MELSLLFEYFQRQGIKLNNLETIGITTLKLRGSQNDIHYLESKLTSVNSEQ